MTARATMKGKAGAGWLLGVALTLFGLGLAGLFFFGMEQPVLGVITALVTLGMAGREAAVALGWWRPDGRPPAAAAPARRAAPAPAAFEPLIAGTAWGGVFLESGPGRVVLCLFPVADRSAFAELDRVKPDAARAIDALVVMNDGDGEHLCGDAVIERLAIEKVYAIEPGSALSRQDGEDHGSRRGEAFPELLELDSVTIDLGHDGVLCCEWDETRLERTAFVGMAMYLGTLAGPPPADYAIGTFDTGGGVPEDFTDVLIKLRHVLLVEGSKDGGCSDFAQFFARLGVNATVLGGARAAAGAGRPAASLFEAALAGGDALRDAAGNAPIEALIETAQSLAVLGELDTAGRATDLFVELHDDERLWFEKAQIELMRGKRESARDSLRRAAGGDPPSPQAQNSLAALLGELGEHDEAVRLAEAAMAALPGDTIALKTAVAVNARGGRRERACALLAEAKELPTADRVRLEMLVAETGEPPEVVHTFPEHARAAREAGAAAIDQGRLAEAERLLRRAVELDPFDAASVTELGVALSRAGREEDAIAAYDEGIERASAGELLRFNRGNALLRLGRHDEARSELERCVALDVPGWHAPRVNLIAVLCAQGKKDEARGHVDALERAGAGPELLGPLRDQVGR